MAALNMAKIGVALTAGLLVCAVNPAHADIYKSVDAQGHVVYSDRATTPAAQKTDVTIQAPKQEEVDRLARQQAILKVVENQRKQQELAGQQLTAQNQQQQHNRQVLCQAARERYYAVRDANHLFHRDADGNRVYLSDSEADARRVELQQAMNTACAVVGH
jgi:tRNA A37 methylthiotransferase MiaB